MTKHSYFLGRSGRGYAYAIKRREESEFMYRLSQGKIAEKLVSDRLISLGFCLKDMSNERMLDESFCPFDLIAKAPSVSVIIQVKSTKAIALFYNVASRELRKWETFVSSSKKILVIATEHRGIRYIEISSIRSVGEQIKKGNYYSIFYKDTLPIESLIP